MCHLSHTHTYAQLLGEVGVIAGLSILEIDTF